MTTTTYKKLQAIDLSLLQYEYSSIKSWYEPIGVCFSDLLAAEKICYQVTSGTIVFQFNDNDFYPKFHIVIVNEGERIVIEKDTVYSFITGNIYEENYHSLHTKYYIADNNSM